MGVEPEDLAGAAELAALAGVSKQALNQWRVRYGGFPKPLVVLAATPVWSKQQFMAWLESSGRTSAGRA